MVFIVFIDVFSLRFFFCLRLWLFHGTREAAAECITENEFQANVEHTSPVHHSFRFAESVERCQSLLRFLQYLKKLDVYHCLSSCRFLKFFFFLPELPASLAVRALHCTTEQHHITFILFSLHTSPHFSALLSLILLV